MRAGGIDFFGGPAFAATRAFPEWKGTKLLCALSKYSYWFMAVRSDLNIKKGDINALKELRISSATAWPGIGLKHMLVDAGIDLERDNVRLVPSPPPVGDKG
jgi:NitT/TauT family transport system substrate-binding protein